jgi:D-psicose/D-tagatose/L-ribulose 3-epimerase
MKLAYSAATEEVSRMALAWVGTLDEILPKIAEIGYEGVEFQVRDPAEIDVAKLKRQVKAAGLEITALSTGTVGQIDKLYVVDRDPAVRQACTERFKAILELAAELGVDAALGGSRGRLATAPSKEEGWAWFDAAVEELVKHAERLGNRLVLEPQCRLNTDFLMTIEETCRYIDRLGSKHVSFEGDVYHQALEERSIVAAWIRGRRHMTYVQLGDSNRLAPGQGFLPWRDMVETLRALDYDGWLSMEHSQLPDSATAARQGFEFMKPLITW